MTTLNKAIIPKRESFIVMMGLMEMYNKQDTSYILEQMRFFFFPVSAFISVYTLHENTKHDKT